MITLTFTRYYAALAFIAEAEGHWEVLRDDALCGDEPAKAELAAATDYCHALNAGLTACDGYAPFTWQMEDRFADMLTDTRDNAAENAENTDDEDDMCRAEDVKIERTP